MYTHERRKPDPDFPLENAPDFETGQGKGVHLKEMSPFIDFVLDHMVDHARMHNARALTPPKGKPLVAITAHGPGIAWVPVLAMVGKHFIDKGMGDRIGGMYPHWSVFLVPGLKRYYERVLGTPTRIESVDDIVESLKKGEIHVTGTAPEGANSVLSFKEYVGPFRSYGMVAAAIKADARLVLLAHQGAESWNLRLKLPFGLSLPNTGGLNGFNIALPPYKKLDHYLVSCKVFKPRLTSRDFNRMDKRRLRLLLHVEVERMRAEMNLMTDKLKDELAALRNNSHAVY